MGARELPYRGTDHDSARSRLDFRVRVVRRYRGVETPSFVSFLGKMYVEPLFLELHLFLTRETVCSTGQMQYG